DAGKRELVVKEDGARQTITNFSLIQTGAPAQAEEAAKPAEAPAAAPSAPPAELPAAARSHLVFFIDQVHLLTADRNKALRGIAEFLPKTLGPNVVAQIATWDRALHIRGEFTNDAAVLGRVLKSIENETALGDIPMRERDGIARQIDRAVTADARTRQVLVPQAVTVL